MTKRRKSALDALGAFEKEQSERAKRAEELRRAAALELGYAVLDAGGAVLDVATLRGIVGHAVRAAEAASAKPRKSVVNG